MAIDLKGRLGAGVSGVSSTTYTLVTDFTVAAVGDVVLVYSASDNTSIVDGDNSEVTGITDTSGNLYTKLAEYTNSPTGVAADGVTISAWMAFVSTMLDVGSTITVTFGTACVDKIVGGYVVTPTAGQRLIASTAATSNEVNAALDFGSATFSGLASKSRLYFRALAKEANSLFQFFPTSGYTSLSGGRSRNATTAVMVRAEARVLTGTGDTSNPSLDVIGDTAGVFIALEESPFTVIKVPPGDLRMRGPQIFDASGPSILVGVAVLTLTMTAPTLLMDRTIPVATTTALALTGPAPTATVAASGEVPQPAAGTLAWTGPAPSVVLGAGITITISPPTGVLRFKGPAAPSPIFPIPPATLTLTGQTPTALFALVAIPKASLALTGQPVIALVQTSGHIIIPTGSLTFTGRYVGQGFKGPDTGTLDLSGLAPSLSFGTGRLTGAGALTFTGRAPNVLATAVPTPVPGSLVLTGQAPGVITAHKALTPLTALVFAGPAPQAVIGAVTSPVYICPPDDLVFTGYAPAVLSNQVISVPVGTLALAGQIPVRSVVGIAQTISPPTGALAFSTTIGPNAQLFMVMNPGTGSLRFSGPNPEMAGAQFGTGIMHYPAWQASVIAAGGG